MDAITVEVIRHALESTAREMSAVMLRTAHAPIFSEGKDYSCAIYDAMGEPIAQSHDCPIHLASIQASLKAALAYLDDPVEPGDTIITNDPYLGGSHLPDITLFRPIFVDEKLSFFAGNRAHHVDVGGGAPGSFVADATEIFQEGLRIPPVKLYSRRIVQDGVLKLILQNVRQPDDLYGDLHAQMAALTHAEHRLTTDLMRRFSFETILGAVGPILDYSESRMRSAIQCLSTDSASAEDYLDNDGIDDRPLKIRATVCREGESLLVDFAGSSPQAAGPANAVSAVTIAATYIAAIASLDPQLPVNGGCYRPIRVKLPPRSIVNPEEPAPCVGGNTYTSLRIIDVVRRALMKAGAPHKAAGHGEHAQLLAGGTGGDGQSYVFYELPPGGWGGTPDTTGASALFPLNANCENTPIEVFETRFPWRVRRRELRRDSGGEGHRNGGNGLHIEYELVSGEATIALACDRQKSTPPGMEGGGSGRAADFFLTRQNHRERLASKVSNVKVRPGDVVTIETSAGGGWGPRNGCDEDQMDARASAARIN